MALQGPTHRKNFSIKGIEPLLNGLGKLAEQFPRRVVAVGFRSALEEFRTHIVEHDVPFKKGILRDSGYVTLKKYTCEIGFGGAAESYAIPQHEHTEWKHRHGRAKYLEQPLLERQKIILKRVAVLCKVQKDDLK